MRQRVLMEAERRSGEIDLRRCFPLSRDFAFATVAVVLLIAAATVRLPARSVAAAISTFPNSKISTSPASITLDLMPPSYSGRQAARLSDPATLEVLAGTRGTLQIRGAADLRVRVNGAAVSSVAGNAQMTFNESGYLAIEAAGVNRLIPLTVVPDRAPEVRITAPAKDLRVMTAATSIPIAAESNDDLGLQSFELRYTVVSGTGEQFSFTEGTLPATILRGSDKAWRLDASLSLARLKLEPGDALIYRAVAADRRPGDAGIAASDTFFVEVAGPGEVPLEGVEMPPDRERYALSQAMIVLKIERLQGRERSLSREALAEAAGNIAAEQRAVRANFIFLLGGEVEDEEIEAETSHEISEGRLANQARREIVNATLLMSKVEKSLSALSTREALPPARDAVRALQRAFGHSRYLLRALPSRARIDPARRLSGDISSALDWSRILTAPAPDPAAEAARTALLDLGEANRAIDDPQRRTNVPAALAKVAERLLAGGAEGTLQSAARDVLAARDALAAQRVDAARAAIARAAGPLVAEAQRGTIAGATSRRGAARVAGAAVVAPGGGR